MKMYGLNIYMYLHAQQIRFAIVLSHVKGLMLTSFRAFNYYNTIHQCDKSLNLHFAPLS